MIQFNIGLKQQTMLIDQQDMNSTVIACNCYLTVSSFSYTTELVSVETAYVSSHFCIREIETKLNKALFFYQTRWPSCRKPPIFLSTSYEAHIVAVSKGASSIQNSTN